MAGEKSIEIVITAKNLSDAELTKARQAIAGFKREAEGATGATSGFGGALRNASSLAGAFGVTLGIAGVVKFGQVLLDDADALVKLADKTGMSTTAVQQLKYIAEQSGNTLEQLTSAVSMLQKRLANGDDSAIAALRGLGIEVERFQTLTPDEQFLAIAREVAKVEDPMTRVKVATDLLGKSGAEVLPSLIANFDELAAAATLTSERTVQALDRAGDKLDELAGKAKTVASEVAVTMLDTFGNFGDFLLEAMRSGAGMALAKTHAEAIGRDLAEGSVKGIRDGFGVLATDGTKSAFEMFSDKNVAAMTRMRTEALAEAKKIAEANARAAEESTRAWLAAWDEMTQGGREAVSDLQASFKQLGDGTLVQVLPDAGTAGRQFEFLKWQIEGVRDVMPPFMAMLPTATGNLTAVGNAAATTGGKIGLAFTSVVPGIKQTLGTLQTAVSGTFAQMMLGAKGFHDGFVDIWSSLKASVTRIFAEIADSFVSGLLKRMLASLSGNKQAFAGGFAGLFAGMGSGGSGGVTGVGSLGGTTPSIASFFGGGGQGVALGGASGSVIGPEMGTGQMLMTGGGGGPNWGAIGGGGMMAAGGIAGYIQARQSGSKLGQTVSGAMTGAGVGTMIMPGIGTAIGAGVGAIAGFASSLFGGNKEYKDVKAQRAEFEQSFGGVDAMMAKISQAYATLGRSGKEAEAAIQNLWQAKDAKAYEAAVTQINAALAKANDLAGLQQQLADRQVMNWQTADELITKYGGTLGNLGQQFVAAKQQASFKEVWDDWQTLIDMGADVGGVLFSMKDEIGALVGESMRIGTEIPEQFKPLIEELIRTGQLFDDNGTKIEDISKLKFGAPLKSESDELKDAILELVKAFKDQLLPTIAGIPRNVDVKVGYKYEDYRPPKAGASDGSDASETYPGYATGALITSEHVARVGEGGTRELIGPVGFMADALAGALASLGLAGGQGASRLVVEAHVHVHARNGRELAELITPELPDVLSSYELVKV
jgi:hypothetical protein